MTVVFLLAMDFEIENLFDLKKFKIIDKFPFSTYKDKKRDIYLIKTGMGKVNAASATQLVLQKYKIKRIINIGLVGGFNRNNKIGDILRVNKCAFHDVDVTPLNFKLGQIPDCDVSEYCLKKNLKNSDIFPKIKNVSLVSGDAFITDQKRVEEIILNFSPDVVDMELAAIAHVLYINKKLDLLESYKAISDYANSNSSEDIFKKENVFKNLKKFVSKLIENI